MSDPRTKRARRHLTRAAAATLACAALLAAPSLAVAAPNHLTLQGYLAESGGTPATGDYTIVLALYDGALAPTAFWEESHTVAVYEGLFDAVLGGDAINPLTVADFVDNDEVWLGVTVIDGPGVPQDGEAELPRRQLSSTGFAFAAGHADTAGTASHATSADSASHATTATSATSAATLSCTGCVTVAQLSFDPATQAELDAAIAALDVPTTVHGLGGGTISGGVTVTGIVEATSFVLSGGATVCTSEGGCGPTLGDLTCVPPNDVAVYDHNQGAWKCSAGTASGGTVATDLSCSGCVDPNELGFEVVTPSGLAVALTDYVTSTGLSAALADYVTQSALDSTLGAYATVASLASYATLSDLESYALVDEVPTSVDGLGGGEIAGSVAVDGTLAADEVRQNGNVVCDASGNCGQTLAGLNCTTNQTIRFEAGQWACADAATGGGPSPTEPCTGPGQALQWDGADWKCVNVLDTGLSQGKANGYEARDDWGDVWDGVARSPRPWAEANQACIDAGGRLPTVTEMWRNRADYGTGNIGTPNDNRYHWTIAPSYRANYYAVVYLSSKTISDATSTSTYPFRCIWKSQEPDGFAGNRCFGPPGAECRTKDSFYNIDRWSRAPQYFPSARKECELENAAIATSDDLEFEIERGTEFVNHSDHGWPFWHWTLDSSYHGNSYSYHRVVRWTKAAEPWWSATVGVASHAGPANYYMFRCVGKKSPDSGFSSADPPCYEGDCFTITTPSRTRLVADASDRPAASWQEAFMDCRADGATLPTTAEFHQLVAAGWGNGSLGNYIWSGSVATWGWQRFRWADVGTPIWNAYYEYGPNYHTSTIGAPKTAYPYRCVWLETEAESFLTCDADEVQMRDDATGDYSCVARVTGDAGGQQNPSNFPPFIDEWGNAFDLFERTAATFPNAKASCESLGARLPVATELYRLRHQQGVVGTELGQPGTATQNYIWTLNPDYRENYQIQLRLSDGAATAVASSGAATAPFRCVWPATKPDAFSGHACYGEPDEPCFEVDRLRTDRYPRAKVPQASAKWECRYFGGRLPLARDVAALQQAGLPNAVSNTYEWSREWAYWSNGTTYAFAPARGTNATQANWQFDQAFNEHNWYTYSNYVHFRCVFSDVME